MIVYRETHVVHQSRLQGEGSQSASESNEASEEGEQCSKQGTDRNVGGARDQAHNYTLRSKEQAEINRSACRVGTKNANVQITAPATPTHPGSVTCVSSVKATAMACTNKPGRGSGHDACLQFHEALPTGNCCRKRWLPLPNTWFRQSSPDSP